MKRPVGLYLIIGWFLLRAVGALVGTVTLVSYARSGALDWRFVFFTFVTEVAIWLLLGFTLLLRWNFGRIVATVWCAVIVAWSSYGFFAVPNARHQVAKVVVYITTVFIHSIIAGYLLRPKVAAWYKYPALSAT
jgi:hypothetical protein